MQRSSVQCVWAFNNPQAAVLTDYLTAQVVPRFVGKNKLSNTPMPSRTRDGTNDNTEFLQSYPVAATNTLLVR
jgi:hypothetical protein